MKSWYGELDGKGRKSFWVAFWGFALDAMDAQLFTFVIPALIMTWGITRAEAGLLATTALIASAVGGWAAGLLADRIGRVRTLRLTVLWFAVATGLAGLAQNFEQLMAARVLQGLGFGGEWAASSILVGEVASLSSRGRAGGMVQSAWAVGWGLAAGLATLVFSLLPAEDAWRVLFFIGLAPGLLIFVHRRSVEEPAIFTQTLARPPWYAIFCAGQRRITASATVLTVGLHSGYYAIATWLPLFLREERGLSVLDSGAYLAVIIFGSFCGYVVGAKMNDSIGRRRTFVVFALASILIALTYTWAPVSDQAILVLGFPLGFFAAGIFSGVGPVLTELFPTELRGSGQSFCYNFGRGLAGLLPLLIGQAAPIIGLGPAIGAYACGGYGLVLLAVLTLPETRGIALRSLSHRAEAETAAP